MKNKSYYTDTVETNNICVKDKPLYINCAGVCALQTDFSGGNKYGRKDFYMMYVYCGKLDITYANTSCILNSGQLLIFSPKTPYSYHNVPGISTGYYWIHFTGTMAEMLINSTNLYTNTPISISVDERIISIFQHIFDEYVTRDELFHTAIIARLIELCTLFGRARISLQNKNRKNISLNKALKYIDDHYAKHITVKDLADSEHLSCGHFRVIFKQKTGMSPTDYITALRLRNACVLLKQTDLTIKEIAQSVGFSDQMYFSRVFTKQFGIPPKIFRK